jgi:hypothetical protein
MFLEVTACTKEEEMTFNENFINTIDFIKLTISNAGHDPVLRINQNTFVPLFKNIMKKYEGKIIFRYVKSTINIITFEIECREKLTPIPKYCFLCLDVISYNNIDD